MINGWMGGRTRGMIKRDYDGGGRRWSSSEVRLKRAPGREEEESEPTGKSQSEDQKRRTPCED